MWTLGNNGACRWKLRVGFLTPVLLLGGAERWIAALCAGLASSEGIHVTGVCTEKGEYYEPLAAKVRRVCPILEGKDNFATIAHQSDILIAWGLMDISKVDGFGGRLVWVSQGYCDWSRACARNAARFATDWVAVSRHAAKSHPNPSSTVIIPNQIDTDRCEPREKRDETRARWGLQPGEIAVGYVGRFAPEKNSLAAVEAVQALGKPYRAVLVGNGSEFSSAIWTMQDTIEQAHKLVPDTIYQSPVEQIGDVFRALDCFVLASPSEGFSLAMAEAWYCKCPVVSTPVVPQEIIDEHGPMSVQVPFNPSGEQLAAAVRKATSAENRPIVEHAAQVAADCYTDAVICRRWIDYLTSLPRLAL
jgi:glycosyltransferase involved in cell wall biosynthesis